MNLSNYSLIPSPLELAEAQVTAARERVRRLSEGHAQRQAQGLTIAATSKRGLAEARLRYEVALRELEEARENAGLVAEKQQSK